VTHKGIAVSLERLGLPDEEVSFLTRLNSSVVVLPEVPLIKETRVDLINQL